MKIKKLEYYSSSEGGKTWIWERHPNIDDITDKINEIIDKLNEREEAEPIRHGKWIECESENGIHFHKCSECGKRDMYQGTFTDWGGRGFSFYFKRQYCPVCGALMDEVEDGVNR